MTSFIDFCDTVKLDWLLKCDKVAGAGRPVPFNFHARMHDLLTLFDSAVKFKLFVGVEEGTSGSAGAALLEERIGH